MTKTLSDLMEFDHVIRVHEDGSVTDAPGVHAPELLDEELSDTDWELMNGYSGQYGYAGPIMHSSEFIGGGLERDILAQPGYYVSLVSYFTHCDCDDAENDISGWAVAYRPAGE